MMTLRDRYNSDNHFKTLVDLMINEIHRCMFTPSEMREAAILASIIYEEQNVRHMVFIENDVEQALRLLRLRLSKG